MKYKRFKPVRYISILLALAACLPAMAQGQRQITISEAIRLGLSNSKTLKLSQARIDEAISRYEQLKDRALPIGSATYAYNHVEIPTTTLQVGNSDPTHLPSRTNAFIGTVTLRETVLDAHRLRYAKEAQDLLIRIARLDSTNDRDDVAYAVINSFYNLYKVQQSRKVIKQNLEAADRQLKQATRFFEQGIVTKNDVLRFQLEKSNVEINGADLDANENIVNYDMNLLLGLPENTHLVAAAFGEPGAGSKSLPAFIDSALNNRQEIKTYDLQARIAETNIKSIRADQYPTLGVGGNLYYINAGGKIVPGANSFIVPISVGATVAWNFDRLWTNKNKVAEARVRQYEAETGKTISVDRVKSEVNRDYQNYLTALERIRIYEASVTQATENDRILESKYQNNIASVTDRIDAGTQLYQTKINLELAKADAGLAWYSLLRSTGTLPQTQSN